MTIEQLFFELIRVAIGTQDALARTPSAKEWKMLYGMAKKQSLVGVCFAGVQKLVDSEKEDYCGMSEMLYLTWMGMAAKIQQRNEVMNRQCLEFQKLCEIKGIKSCVLKGQGNLPNYGVLRMLRQSGDIDAWVDCGFKKANEWVQSVAPTNDINHHHIHFDVFQDTEVELHYYPFVLNNPYRNKVLDKFFKEQAEMQFTNFVELPNMNEKVTVATNDFNLVFQLVHIFHHLFNEGIGLRQLMDYHFVVKHEVVVGRVSDVQKVKKVVSDLGLDRFASALMWVLGHVFGLEDEYMLWAPAEKNGRFLLNEIMMAGNFGHYDERIPKGMSYWESFCFYNFHSIRLTRFDKWNWFWTPLLRVKWFLWRKIHAYK